MQHQVLPYFFETFTLQRKERGRIDSLRDSKRPRQIGASETYFQERKIIGARLFRCELRLRQGLQKRSSLGQPVVQEQRVDVVQNGAW